LSQICPNKYYDGDNSTVKPSFDLRVRDVEAGGSNPLTPTRIFLENSGLANPLFLFVAHLPWQMLLNLPLEKVPIVCGTSHPTTRSAAHPGHAFEQCRALCKAGHSHGVHR